jgi:hypothetical protein
VEQRDRKKAVVLLAPQYALCFHDLNLSCLMLGQEKALIAVGGIFTLFFLVVLFLPFYKHASAGTA